jgi:ribosomal protein S18 acetylase RimI-like enzyme
VPDIASTPRRAGIRPATRGDASALAELAERTFRAAFAAFNSRENMDAHCARSYGVAIQAAEIADPRMRTFVCDDGGRLAGYGQLRWGPAPACVDARRPVEIQRIYVDQRDHGKGVAQALMSAMLAAAGQDGAEVVWLGVWESNPRAIAFYRKLGFDRVGEHVFQVGDDPQRDWIMCRRVLDSG